MESVYLLVVKVRAVFAGAFCITKKKDVLYMNRLIINLLFFCCLIFLLFSCDSERVSDWQRFGLSGSVKSYTEELYEVSGDSVSGWVCGSRLVQGHQRVYFSGEGFHERTDYLNVEGETMDELVIVRHGGDSFTEVYYRNGNAVNFNEIKILSDKEFSVLSKGKDKDTIGIGMSYFDEDYRLLEQVFNDYRSQERYITHYTYDSEGRQVGVVRKNSDSLLIFSIVYDYLSTDSLGNWTERVVYTNKSSSSPSVLAKRSYEYY